MTALDPSIVFWGQWVVFLAVSALGVWSTGYALWASMVLGEHWLKWLSRRRDVTHEQSQIALQYLKVTKELEFQTTKLTKEMELKRIKAHEDALNRELAPQAVDEGPLLPQINLVKQR